MAFSFRAIQAAFNGSPFNTSHLHALNDIRPIVLQNVLRGTFSQTSTTTLAPVGVGTQAGIAAGSQLYLELNGDESVATSGMWKVQGQLFMTGVLVGIGMKCNLLAADGLQFANTGFSGFEIDLNNTGAAPVSAYGFASATATNTAATTAVFSSVWFSGVIQVIGSGGLYVQTAQNVSTGTAIVVGAGSWIQATAIGQLEH